MTSRENISSDSLPHTTATDIRSSVHLPEKKYIIDIQSSLDRLKKADPSNVLEVVSSQLELMAVYHNEVLKQARGSFQWAIVAAGVGLAFFLAAVGFVLYQAPENAAVISLISGGMIEFISVVNFYMYGKASVQMADFQNRLDITQRHLVANSICEGLEGDTKQEVRAGLIRAIAGIDSSSIPRINTETSVLEAISISRRDKQAEDVPTA